MNWTTPAELKAQVQRLWDRGLLLQSSIVGADVLFPRRLVLRGPSSADLTDRFDEVRKWIVELQDIPLRVSLRELEHRVIGRNKVPQAVWVDTLDDALRLVGKTRDAQRFSALASLTVSRRPELIALLARRPLQVLALETQWPLLLDVVDWIALHPRPGIYLRQIDAPGVHTKFVETHLGILAEMLDLVLPADAVNALAGGTSQFCARYGFRERPLRIRFRTLDPDLGLLPLAPDQDVTLDQRSFADLAIKFTRVFVTENETNFLAFPPMPRAMVIFGAGYGFEQLERARWLGDTAMFYWGDIDTHGFAILDQLRSHFPHARSFLMDRLTLLSHRSLWGTEPKPEKKDLHRLTAEELELFADLRADKIGKNVRLEQERVGYDWLVQSLRSIDSKSA